MNKRLIFIFVGVVLLLAALWLVKHRQKPAPTIAAVPASATPAFNQPAANPTQSPANTSTAHPPALPPTTSPQIDSKVAGFQAQMAADNAKPQDFYGKVVDQYGQPVESANVLGTLLWEQGFDVGEKREQHTIQTDHNGEFQFTGFTAWRLAVAVSKAGYEMDSRGRAYKAPNAANKTSPTARAIFTMWKLKGAEPMVHAKVHAYVPCDGTATRYDILTGRKAASGDLVLTLTRNPVNIVRGHPFDWTATVELPNGGGFVALNDTYPNEAPTEGYQPKLTIEMPAKMKGWDAAFERSYYFKSGNIYGRMTVSIQADFQPPPTSFDVEIFANPSGSRNLEFDSAQAITP